MGLFILISFFLLFVSSYAQTRTLKINTTSAVEIAQSINQQVQRFFTSSYISPVLSNNAIIQAASSIGPSYANPFMTAKYNISANTTLQYLVWTAFKSNNYCPINLCLTNKMYMGYSWNPTINNGAGGYTFVYQSPTSAKSTTYFIDSTTGVPTSAFQQTTFDCFTRVWYKSALALSKPPTSPYVFPPVSGSALSSTIVFGIASKFNVNGVFTGVISSFQSTAPPFSIPTLSVQLQQFNTQPFVVIYIMQTNGSVLVGTNVGEALTFNKTAFQASNAYIQMSASYIAANKITTSTTQVSNGNVICVNFVALYSNQYTIVTVDYGTNPVASVSLSQQTILASATKTINTTLGIAIAILVIVITLLIGGIIHVYFSFSSTNPTHSRPVDSGRATELNSIYSSSNPTHK